jgi:tetratricopeptide (TPR) repeat protein
VCEQYPGLPETIEAKVGMASIFFEMNQFHNSLNILTPLEEHPETVYAHPKILGCLGNNYYQLGFFTKAREYLFRFFNSFPDQEENHLTLARIADAYREEGLQGEAIKFYKLVLKRYPKTEGALISMYRLAALQENGDLSSAKGPLPNLKIIGGDIDMPRKIYEDVIQNAIEKDSATPLLQFALLKLSIMDHKEEKYEKSLERLKTLQKKYPRTKLNKEIEQAFEKTLLSILKAHIKVKKYTQVLNTYQAEKAMIKRLNSPEIYITVGRAAIELNLVGAAVDMFDKAALQLPDENKPADLLFYVGREYFNNGEHQSALTYLDLLLKNYPDDEFSAEAWMLKGKIFFIEKAYERAAGMFSNALKHHVKPCQEARLLIEHAKSLIHLESNEDALQVLLGTGKSMKNCHDGKYQQYEEIGNLFIQLGNPEKALSTFKQALILAVESSSKARLKILMAQCHELMDDKESSLEIYSEIANMNDPFWRNVAREKMETINFKPLISQNR